jgi:hypothetical protein
MKAFLAPSLGLALMVSTASAWAEDTSGCVDTWPEDRKRPSLKESFPLKGIAGHVAFLDVAVDHLPGEQVFPAGIRLAPDSEEATWLTAAEFQLLHRDAIIQPSLGREESKAGASSLRTKIHLPLLPLPKEPGRKELTLPRLPISISRASGQVHTLCTQPHVMTVEDPLASNPNPEKHPDPKPRAQMEVWTALRDAVISVLIALPIAVALAWLFLKLRKKWKKVPKPPPPRPPWETALAELEAIEARRLLEAEHHEEYLDAVSDTLRHYLGERYGFDGLESTTRETLRQLAVRATDFDDERAVRTILQRADLVKFARRLPSNEECLDAMGETRRIIRITTRAPNLDPRSPQPGSSSHTKNERERRTP